MSMTIYELLCFCQENFEKGNLESALRCAVSICMRYPYTSQPYAHVTAYRVHLAAANNRTATGEPDWYAVFGVKRTLPSDSLAKAVTQRYLKIMEVLDDESRPFKAVTSIDPLLRRAMAELMDEDRRRAYDQRSGFSPVYKSLV